MFWKRKQIISSTAKGFPIALPPIPPKKEYEIMLELLREAEHFSHSGDSDVEKEQLEMLKRAIDRYKPNAT